jgi:hypothetical protein
MRAHEKCGYCPATRNALKASRLRHETYEETSSEGGFELTTQEELDPEGALVALVEQLNHEVVQKLEDLGYDHTCAEYKRFAKWVTTGQLAGRAAVETVAGSRERQDLLMECSTDGSFF